MDGETLEKVYQENLEERMIAYLSGEPTVPNRELSASVHSAHNFSPAAYFFHNFYKFFYKYFSACCIICLLSETGGTVLWQKK